jgi:hypothetical protein
VVDVVVDEGCRQVVRCADGVHIPGQVKVEVLHRNHLGVAAARCAALDPEHRSQAGLADRDRRPQPEALQPLGETDGRGALALAERRRTHPGDDDVLAARTLTLQPLDPGQRDLRLRVSVQLNLIVAQDRARGRS